MRVLLVASSCMFVCAAFFTPLTMIAQLDIHALQSLTATRYAGQDFSGTWIYVSSKDQKMYLLEGWQIKAAYPVSTAKAGLGSQSGSNQTPLGLHRIKARFGDDIPAGGILKARAYTREVAEIHTDAVWRETDLVTSRILWLEGLEAGKNKGKDAVGKTVDSYGRYIYIHGTPEEGMIGKPASHGCIRMRNADIIALYARLKTGALVLIG